MRNALKVCGPRNKGTYRGVVLRFRDPAVPALLWCCLSFSLLSSHTEKLAHLLSKTRRRRRTEVPAVNSEGSFHFPGFPLSPHLSCPHLVWRLRPPLLPLNILIKRNCSERTRLETGSKVSH